MQKKQAISPEPDPIAFRIEHVAEIPGIVAKATARKALVNGHKMTFRSAR
jgi:hypothetical protein